MRKSTLLIASFIFLVITACDTEKETEANVVETLEPALVTPTPTNELSNVLSDPSLEPIAAPILTAPAKINPAHGQPGHDCAVAVGDPLPTSSALQTAAPTAAPVSNNNSTVAFNPLGAPAPRLGSIGNASSANLNPAHGQPGHDCAVAVGAPLSGSSVAAPVSVPNNASAFNPLGAPAPNLGSIGSASSANLNPAHGQPGHDCAVAVGAPLPSK